jgi:hypothetical protein
MGDRLDELSRSNALLNVALTELRGYRISIAIAEALFGVGVTDAQFSEFLDLAARDIPPDGRYSLALMLPAYIDRRRAGHEALDYLLAEGDLSEDAISSVAGRMVGITTADAVLWCHQRLTTVIRRDREYYEFLRHHIATLVDRCRDDMVAYLLYPDRGPDKNNVYSFDLVIRALDDPGPFLGRWQEWIWNGLFNSGEDDAVKQRSHQHYRLLNRCWDEPVFLALRTAMRDYVAALLRSHDPAKRAAGARHLAIMVNESYLGAGELVDDVPVGEFRLLYLALAATAAANAAPADRALRDRADALRSEVLDHDLR